MRYIVASRRLACASVNSPITVTRISGLFTLNPSLPTPMRELFVSLPSEEVRIVVLVFESVVLTQRCYPWQIDDTEIKSTSIPFVVYVGDGIPLRMDPVSAPSNDVVRLGTCTPTHSAVLVAFLDVLAQFFRVGRTFRLPFPLRVTLHPLIVGSCLLLFLV